MAGHHNTLSRVGRGWAAITALAALAAVVLQYALLLQATAANEGLLRATAHLLSYFTILSNLAVAAVCVPLALGAGHAARHVSRLGAVALYIGITAAIYGLVLHQLWQPQGAQWWADVSLHRLVPLLYLLGWLAWVPHGGLRWRDLLRWLIFPALYLLWVWLLSGYTGRVPYPFLEVERLGALQTLLNALQVTLAFVMLGVLVVGIDRWFARRR